MWPGREERLAGFRRIVPSEHDDSDMKTATVRGGAYTATSVAIDFILRMGSVAILARLLLPEHFGLIAMVLAITSVAERFKDLGLSLATVQSREISHQQVSTLFWVNAGLGMACALTVALMAIPIADFYRDERLVGITLAISITFVWSGLTIQHEALLRRAMKFGYIAAIGLAANVLSMAVSIAMALYGCGYWSLVAREIARSVFLAVGIWLACRWIPDPPSRQAGVASMMRFGGHIAATHLTALLSQNSGSIVVGRFFGASPAGFYRQGQNLVLFPFEQLSYPVWIVSEPILSRLQDDPEKYRRYYGKLLTMFSGITLPLGVYLMIYAEEIVLFVLGPTWTDATLIFRLMAASALITPTASTIGLVMVTCGRSQRYLALGLLGATMLVAFSIIGASWGPAGVAAAPILAAGLLLVPRLYFGLRGTPVSIGNFFTCLTRPMTAAVIMGISLVALKAVARADGALVTLSIGAVAAVATYLVGWALLPGGRAELVELTGDVVRALRRRRAVQRPA